MSEQTAIQPLKQFVNDIQSVWADTKEIRSIFAPTLTEPEFKLFVSLGIQTRSNPFKREIWAVKYQKDKPAAIFLGRDKYRSVAQANPDYNGHVVDSVCENDDIVVENGQLVRHRWAKGDRGKLIGGYCIVKRKSIETPFFVHCKFSEYDKHQSSWNQTPDTMIKKVPEAQALRMAFQDEYSGMYAEDEVPFVIDSPRPPQDEPKTVDMTDVKLKLWDKLLKHFELRDRVEAWIKEVTKEKFPPDGKTWNEVLPEELGKINYRFQQLVLGGQNGKD